MARRRPRLPPPLPPRHGLDPARVRLPADGAWATVRDHLVERLPVDPARVEAMLAEGRVVDRSGPLTPDSPYRGGTSVWFHRDLPDETPVPFAVTTLHRDARLLVADKPHFLATTPRGRHVLETALVRLRTEHGLPELGPAHRLDRATAGVALFVVDPAHRGAYQTLFRDRRITKTYEALAPHDPDLDLDLDLPRVVRSRIEKQRGRLAAVEVDGEPNAETLVERLAVRGALARYRLTPRTGRTHQLRVHMAGLGIPILGDPFFPVLRDTALDDFRAPLQLLARRLAFTDPVDGSEREFTSARRLAAWDDPAGWAAGPPGTPSP